MNKRSLYLWVSLIGVSLSLVLVAWFTLQWAHAVRARAVTTPVVVLRLSTLELQVMLTPYPDCAPVGYSCGHRLLSLAPLPPARHKYFVLWEVEIVKGATGRQMTSHRLIAIPVDP